MREKGGEEEGAHGQDKHVYNGKETKQERRNRDKERGRGNNSNEEKANHRNIERKQRYRTNRSKDYTEKKRQTHI